MQKLTFFCYMLSLTRTLALQESDRLQQERPLRLFPFTAAAGVGSSPLPSITPPLVLPSLSEVSASEPTGPTTVSGSLSTASVTTTTQSATRTGWIFDSTYDPTATFSYDFQATKGLSLDMWNDRKIGDWLIEYSFRHGIADSDTYFLDLVNTPAFDAPQLTCQINDDNCKISPGEVHPGIPNDDEFNALLVMSATASFVQWLQDIYKALDTARGEMALILQPLLIKRVLYRRISLALLFDPAGAIIASIAEKAVTEAILKGAEGAFIVTEQQIQDATTKMAKDLTGQLNRGFGYLEKGWKVLRDVIPLMPSTGGKDIDQEVPDASDYSTYVASEITFFQDQLGNTLDSILNNGFYQDGLISQIYNGDYVQPWPNSGNFLSNQASQASAEAMQMIGAAAVGNIAHQNNVILVKRLVSFGDHDSCMGSFTHDFDWAADGADCRLDKDGLWYPMFSIEYELFDTSLGVLFSDFTCQRVKTFRGWKAVSQGGKYDQFTMDPLELWNSSKDCAVVHSSYAYGSMSFYNQPDLANINDLNVALDSLTCYYNLPFCDMTSPVVQEGCIAYRNDLAADTGRSGFGDWEYPTCMETELLRFCAQTLAIYNNAFDIKEVSNAYANKQAGSISSISPGPSDGANRGYDCFPFGD